MFSFIGMIIKFAVYSVVGVVALTIVVMFATNEEKTIPVAKIEQSVQETAVVKTKNAANDMLIKLPMTRQLVAMSNIIRTADYSCSSATSRKFKLFDGDGNAIHVVTCLEGKYMVRIENDAQGSTSVLTCAFVRLLDIKC